MNYRDYKQFAPNNYYHIFNRGTGKMDIFKDDEDRFFFLRQLKENIFPDPTMGTIVKKSLNGYIKRRLPGDSFSLIAYCLMPNHFHILIRQDLTTPISALIARVCTSYGKYFNKKHERVGSLFQDAFKAIRLDSDSYLLWLSAYIHLNPKTAGLVESLDDYKWSSYKDYVGLRQGSLCDSREILGQFKSPVEYQSFVLDAFEKIKERKELEIYLLD